MKSISQRGAFTALMTLMATLLGAAFGFFDLRFQPDWIADVFKITALMVVASSCVSFVIWSVTHIKRDSVMRGALAGLLTGALLVPVPYAATAFKGEVLRLYSEQGKGLIMAAVEAVPLSVKTGLETYLVITKVSLAAVIGSVVLGALIGRFVPARD